MTWKSKEFLRYQVFSLRNAAKKYTTVFRPLTLTRIILKPAVGAGGRNISKINLVDTKNGELLPPFESGHGALVQPFVHEIQECGEWALLFFGTSLVHSVHKSAAANEYRIQRQYGGTERRAAPPPEVVKVARDGLSLMPGNPVFARADVLGLAKPLIVELEAIEPRLYFDAFPQFVEAFISAIRSRFRL